MQVSKTSHVRSKAILEACREIPCQHCGAEDGTVVAAHSNQGSKHGKGMGLKSDDRFVAALCYHCHTELDSGKLLTRFERVSMWDAAHEKTVHELKARGLWPKWIPYEVK